MSDLSELPTSCNKCGARGNTKTHFNAVWIGPRYDSFCDRLIYRCEQCEYTISVLPIDRRTNG